MVSLGRIAAWIGLLTMTGCGSDVVGDWDFEDNGDGFSDSMQLEDGGEGSREIRGYLFASCGGIDGEARITLTFDVEWEQDEDMVDLELKCAKATATLGDCESLTGCGEVGDVFDLDLDFDGECELNADGDELDCDFDGAGDTVTFEKDR